MFTALSNLVMRPCLLLLALGLSVSTDASALQRGGVPGASMRSILLASPSAPNRLGPRQLWIGQSTSAIVTSIATPAEAVPGFIPGVGGLALVLSIVVEETQEEELFTLFVPSTPPGVERPMLVAFHGFNVSHLDIWANTSFISECQARGWFLIAPYMRNLAPTGPGTSQSGFGSAQSQLHVQAVMRYVMEGFPVDLDRIYGVGFSMGGGAAMSYAARHRDRDEGAFAAVVNHTGTVALQHVYANADNDTQGLMRRIFGGNPQYAPFNYNRSSVIELDANGVLVSGGDHMARNLSEVPVRTYYGVGDGQGYLVDEALQLDGFMSTISSTHELVALPADCTPVQGGHCWATIDETEVCDWLETKVLGTPGQIGQVLADRNARWGNLDVTPTLAGVFSSFDYSISSSQNSIRLLGTSNLESVRFNLNEVGLDRTSPVGLRLGTADGSGDTVHITGYGGAPSSIVRNGWLVIEDCSSASLPRWCYDPSTDTLSITETAPQTALWTVNP